MVMGLATLCRKATLEKIGIEHGLSRPWVEEQVEYMIDHLPDSSKVDKRYRPEVELTKGYRPRALNSPKH
jgi:hypothetical protein